MENWLEGAGATGLNYLSLDDFSVGGRGLKTLRRFKAGEKILTIPGNVLWTVEHAYADPLLGPALHSVQPLLSVDDTLAVYLLFVRSRESEHDGPRSHVAALPVSYSSTIFFTEEELEVCVGTSLYTITKQLEQQIEDDYKGVLIQLLTQHRDLFPLEKFSLDDYKWALCTIWSRAMDFELADGKSIRLLAPFADMLNHSPDTKQCHAYDPLSGNLSILAGKDYEVGDQVFIYYGSIPNSRLLRLYGFVMPNNPSDSYDLVLSTHPDAPLFEMKQRLWVMAGLDSVSTIPLTLADPLPRKVLQYLRIQRLSPSDLASATIQQKDPASEKISDANEAEILQFLAASISENLQNFGIQLERLEKQLAEGHYSPGGNAWAAAQVSLGEQKVLRRAKKTAEDLLAKMNSGDGGEIASSSATTQCANCKKTSGQLKLCARCNVVMYCGRDCQVAHYKEHKATCLAIANGKEIG